MAQEWAADEQKKNAEALDAFEQTAARRLACAVVLLARRGSPEGRLIAEAFNLVAAGMPRIREVQRDLLALTCLFRVRETAPASQGRVSILYSRATRSLKQLNAELGNAPCPPGCAVEPMTLAEWCGLRPADQGSVEPDHVVQAYLELLGRIVALTRHIEQDLAAAADAPGRPR